jgi:hypothetical protein
MMRFVKRTSGVAYNLQIGRGSERERKRKRKRKRKRERERENWRSYLQWFHMSRIHVEITSNSLRKLPGDSELELKIERHFLHMALFVFHAECPGVNECS